MTSAANPGIRIFIPLKSWSEYIGFLNQPPIWTPVFPEANAFNPNSPYASSHSSWPPPYCNHALCSVTVRPPGTEQKKGKLLCLATQ